LSPVNIGRTFVQTSVYVSVSLEISCHYKESQVVKEDEGMLDVSVRLLFGIWKHLEYVNVSLFLSAQGSYLPVLNVVFFYCCGLHKEYFLYWISFCKVCWILFGYK
jgi:hypothetical protein